MKLKSNRSALSRVSRGAAAGSVALLLAVVAVFSGTCALSAADDAAAQKLLGEARVKEVHAQELRAAAAAAMQKAADDNIAAGAAEREARILTAQALKIMGADPNRQKAFRLREEARKLWLQSRNMAIAARNDGQKAAQLTHDSEELRKSAAELKDQPTVAASLENEAKELATEAQNATQAAGQAKYGAQSLDDRGKTAWAEAEKLDPELHRQAAPPAPKPVIAQPRQVN